ncbi:hypothetical protein [Streptomyces mirabilis]|uniref:hypothetical protein n=1 Tax=Streptomyces mirabilis TaxID=68239 RepID=UPI003689DAD3
MRHAGRRRGTALRASSVLTASGSIRRAELDRLLEFAVHDTRVLAGAIFLLASHGQALRLEVTAGLPAKHLTPLSRVALSSPVPVREALRQRRLVWLSDPGEFAQAYPRTAIALPYHCAPAAAPIITGTRAWGTPLLLWPGSDTAGVAGPGPDRVAAACRRLGRFLRDAADTGHAVRPGPAPRTLPHSNDRTLGSSRRRHSRQISTMGTQVAQDDLRLRGPTPSVGHTSVQATTLSLPLATVLQHGGRWAPQVCHPGLYRPADCRLPPTKLVDEGMIGTPSRRAGRRPLVVNSQRQAPG